MGDIILTTPFTFYSEELCKKFEATMLDIKARVEGESSQRQKVQAEYTAVKGTPTLFIFIQWLISFVEKFKQFLEQYHLREKHFTSLHTAQTTELNLSTTKLSHMSQLYSSLLSEHASLQSTYDVLKKSEQDMKDQLSTYIEKFTQVEATLGKSNQLFTSFRAEMQEMAKSTKMLEAENKSLRKKLEELDNSGADVQHVLQVTLNQKQRLEGTLYPSIL